MPTLPLPTLAISIFDHAWDTAPKPRSTSVEGLIRALTRFPVIPTAKKLALPAWSPARFASGRPRCAEAVLDVSCLVLDCDHGDPDLALSPWTGLIAVAHSTWSHTEPSPRFRVVVPLARPIPADRWPRAWAWAHERAPGSDPACKDASRLYFRPAVRSLEAPRFVREVRGELLDLLALLPDGPPPTPAVARRPPLLVPARMGRHAIHTRLAHDPASRERVAAEVGAAVVGDGPRRRASGATCPACGRASVWFFLAPDRLRRARCNHRNSCGWTGPLDELLLGRAA